MARPRGFRLNRTAFDDFLKLLGTTQTDVAKKAGMPEQTLSSLVHGGGASIKTARQLADTLGCEPATLFPELGRFEHKDALEPESVA